MVVLNEKDGEITEKQGPSTPPISPESSGDVKPAVSPIGDIEMSMANVSSTESEDEKPQVSPSKSQTSNRHRVSSNNNRKVKTVRSFLHEPGYDELKDQHEKNFRREDNVQTKDKSNGPSRKRRIGIDSPRDSAKENATSMENDDESRKYEELQTLIRREALVNPNMFMQRCNEMIVRGDAMGGDIPDEDLITSINEALILELELDSLIEKKKNLKNNLMKMCDDEKISIRNIHSELPAFMQGVVRIDGDNITINDAPLVPTPTTQQPTSTPAPSNFSMFPTVPSMMNGVPDGQPPVINTTIPPPMFVPPPAVMDKPPPVTITETSVPTVESQKTSVTSQEPIFTIRAQVPLPSMMMQPPPTAQPFNPSQQPPPAPQPPTMNLNVPPPFVPGVTSFTQPPPALPTEIKPKEDKEKSISQPSVVFQQNTESVTPVSGANAQSGMNTSATTGGQFKPNNDLSRTITSLITNALKNPSQSPVKGGSSPMLSSSGTSSSNMATPPRPAPPSLIQMTLPPPANLQRSSALSGGKSKSSRKTQNKKKFSSGSNNQNSKPLPQSENSDANSDNASTQ